MRGRHADGAGSQEQATHSMAVPAGEQTHTIILERSSEQPVEAISVRYGRRSAVAGRAGAAV
eukprot:COSAG02_NODE_2156_length_9643_cov_55.052761_6_plen_62_part_00